MRVKDQESGKIEAKPTWHHFGVKIKWFGPQTNQKKKKKAPKRRAHDLENQDVS
jgi:hypothetical protein